VLQVPGYWRKANLDSLLRSPVELTTLLAQGPAVVVLMFQSWIAPVDILLLMDEDSGETTNTIFTNDTNFALASSAHSLGVDEYIVGSVFVGAAGPRTPACAGHKKLDFFLGILYMMILLMLGNLLKTVRTFVIYTLV